MAKKFGGFTPQQQQTLLSKMGYSGPAQQDDINKFMMASPKASSMMGMYMEQARKRIAGASPVGLAEGGAVIDPLTGQPKVISNDITQPVETLPIYSGPITAETSKDILKMSTGSTAADLQYDFNGDGKITSADALVAAKKGAAQGTVTADAAGVYDPTTGLPTAPAESIAEADVAPFLEKIAGGSTGAGAEVNIPGITEMLSSGNIPEDPTDYKITGSKRNWTITYADGTTLKSPYNRLSSITAEAANIAGVLNEYKESDPYKAYGVAGEQYKAKLGQYQDYYKGASSVSPEQSKTNLDTAQALVAQEQTLLTTYTNQLANMDADDPQRATLQKLIDDQQIEVTKSKAGLSQAGSNLKTVGTPSTGELQADMLTDPTSITTKADVVRTTDEQAAAGKIDEGTGQIGPVDKATGRTTTVAGEVGGPDSMTAATFDADKVSDDVKATLATLEASTGKPSDEALADAATMSPEDLAQLGLTVEQITQAQTVQAPDARTIEAGELISGSTVDMDRAKKEINFEAATGAPSTDATVQGQLTGLMEQFEGGNPPPWAAGAMRAASALMASRGLGASSMAGQAILQSAMEAALPIATQDANTSATFELKNLSNRQATALFAAEKRAEFLNLEFTQEFQTRVTNAAKISDIANLNFSADVQIALENAQMAQTVDLANMSAKNAKVLSDAAAMTNIEMTNLNNRQQAQIQQANAFLNMDMANLDNEQQTSIFKAQAQTNAMLSDQAAVNAAKQFNASSENQTNQFFESLTSTIAQFNVDQSNAMERFQTEEANTLSRFNTQQKNEADKFNAQNSLLIAQANAQWAQATATSDNAADNQANRDEAVAANGLTTSAYNSVIQKDRDLMSWAWQSAESASDRDANITMAKIDASGDEGTDAFSKASGSFLTKLAINAADTLFN